MKRVSLRMRLTLITVAVLSVIAAAITLINIYNNNVQLAQPISTYLAYLGDSYVEVSVDSAPAIQEYDAVSGVTTPSGLIKAVPSEDYSITAAIDDDAYYSAMGGLLEYNSIGAADFSQSVSFATLQISEAKNTYDYTSILIMLGMIVVGGVVVYFVSAYALKPVHVLSGSVREITEKKLSTRVEGFTAGDEITQLAESFNGMLGRLETAFQAQKRFSIAAAHELKTPLAAIRANIDVLEMDEVPSAQEYAETIGIIKNQTARMTQLVEDLFVMSDLREYPMDDAVDIGTTVQAQLDELEPAIREKNLIVQTICGRLPVRGNQVMLGRAIGNLIENAVKYNRAQGSLEVRCAANGGFAIIAIADTGIGVPDSQLPYIFDAFFRVDSSRSRKHGGAGLGLAIAKEIVEHHGGTIEAAINPAKGLTVTIQLPLLQPALQ